MKAQLVDIEGAEPHERIVWYCPGCKSDHGVPVPPHKNAWGWNSSLNEPTLNPSVLIRYNVPDAGKNGASQAICHCFIRDGNIQFLSDCTHDHAGKTVPMKDIE